MKSAETQLIDFLKANPSVFASAQLQRMFWKNKNGSLASPRSIVRRLEENTYTPDNPQGVLEVSYVGGNAHYRIREEHRKKVQHVDFILKDGIRTARVTYA